ncbi:hypothetical protein Taro_050194 [Colocasia esculenta]|uniref:FAR1-related sequence 11-like HTH-like domain-containing protein n=1 Tax=Colocasia esculenta TaxID=4460 RepID=A0A843XDF3_COLES|nr:hypothetical protein [Colocasia esculenta]
MVCAFSKNSHVIEVVKVGNIQMQNYIVTQRKSDAQQHNHSLNPLSVVYLRSHQHICTPEKAEMVNMRSAGISTSKIVSCMAKRKGGIRQLDFMEKDCKNFLERERQTQLKEGDVKTML